VAFGERERGEDCICAEPNLKITNFFVVFKIKNYKSVSSPFEEILLYSSYR